MSLYNSNENIQRTKHCSGLLLLWLTLQNCLHTKAGICTAMDEWKYQSLAATGSVDDTLVSASVGKVTALFVSGSALTLCVGELSVEELSEDEMGVSSSAGGDNWLTLLRDGLSSTSGATVEGSDSAAADVHLFSSSSHSTAWSPAAAASVTVSWDTSLTADVSDTFRSVQKRYKTQQNLSHAINSQAAILYTNTLNVRVPFILWLYRCKYQISNTWH